MSCPHGSSLAIHCAVCSALPPECTVRNAESAVSYAHKRLAEALDERRTALKVYAKARPLGDGEHAHLIRRVEDGGPLCCADGLEWLKCHLPDIWARAINVWAGEILGCGPISPRVKALHLELVRALKRDEMPEVFLRDD